MKVAIVGNMNNGGFCLLRYFRDLGADAHLLPYATDGTGNLAHFRPEDDTHEIERWLPYVHQLAIENTTTALLLGPCRLQGLQGLTAGQIAGQLGGYDAYVGSGIAPALFARWGRPMDVFFPYSTGIEFYANAEYAPSRHVAWFKRPFRAYVRELQASGIRAARYCLSAEMSHTRAAFDKIGKPFKRMAIPAVYNRESTPEVRVSSHVEAALRQIKNAELSIFCCARQMWVRDTRLSGWNAEDNSKNSDWLFRGLAQFLASNPEARPLLTVVEYGPDVEASKRLACALGVEPFVLWLPKMARKTIMRLIDAADLGVGEFYMNPGVIWGGTGWEVLASGRPLLQSFNFEPTAYTSEFGQPPPPILDVKSAADFAAHLGSMYRNPKQREVIGEASAGWFNRYNGIGLARQWLELLQPEESYPR